MEVDPELEELRKKRALALKDEIEMRSSMPGTTVEVTDDNFKDMVARYPYLLIDFWAPWCGPCKMIGPILDQLAGEYKGKLVIGKLNVDENPVTSRSFRVASIPTMIIVKEREMVERITGAMPKVSIVQHIEKHLDKE
jgi:thioredoxin 1